MTWTKRSLANQDWLWYGVVGLTFFFPCSLIFIGLFLDDPFFRLIYLPVGFIASQTALTQVANAWHERNRWLAKETTNYIQSPLFAANNYKVPNHMFALVWIWVKDYSYFTKPENIDLFKHDEINK